MGPIPLWGISSFQLTFIQGGRDEIKWKKANEKEGFFQAVNKPPTISMKGVVSNESMDHSL